MAREENWKRSLGKLKPRKESAKRASRKKNANVDDGEQTLSGLGAGELGKSVLRREVVACLGLCRRETRVSRKAKPSS